MHDSNTPITNQDKEFLGEALAYSHLAPTIPESGPEATNVNQSTQLAAFGKAELYKSLDGVFELRGGTEQDKQKAEEWLRMFYPDVADELFGPGLA